MSFKHTLRKTIENRPKSRFVRQSGQVIFEQTLSSAVRFMGEQLKELISLVKESKESPRTGHNKRLNVIDTLSDEERARIFLGLVRDAGRDAERTPGFAS